MENPRNLLKRIKWKSVSLVIILLLVVFFIVLGFNPLGMDYKGKGDIKIKSWLEPGRVDLEDESTVWVEIKNTGKKSQDVIVSLKTYDPDVKFLDDTQEKTASRNLGPGESRELDFKVNIKATDGGKYGISIKAEYEHEIIRDEVYLSVVSS